MVHTTRQTDGVAVIDDKIYPLREASWEKHINKGQMYMQNGSTVDVTYDEEYSITVVSHREYTMKKDVPEPKKMYLFEDINNLQNRMVFIDAILTGTETTYNKPQLLEFVARAVQLD